MSWPTSPFEWVLAACITIVALSVLSALVLILKERDFISRAVVSDLVFYGMVVIYLIWTITHATSISYEIAILAALAGGVLPTLSMSRIISKGRR